MYRFETLSEIQRTSEIIKFSGLERHTKKFGYELDAEGLSALNHVLPPTCQESANDDVKRAMELAVQYVFDIFKGDLFNAAADRGKTSSSGIIRQYLKKVKDDLRNSAVFHPQFSTHEQECLNNFPSHNTQLQVDENEDEYDEGLDLYCYCKPMHYFLTKPFTILAGSNGTVPESPESIPTSTEGRALVPNNPDNESAHTLGNRIIF